MFRLQAKKSDFFARPDLIHGFLKVWKAKQNKTWSRIYFKSLFKPHLELIWNWVLKTPALDHLPVQNIHFIEALARLSKKSVWPFMTGISLKLTFQFTSWFTNIYWAFRNTFFKKVLWVMPQWCVQTLNGHVLSMYINASIGALWTTEWIVTWHIS